MRYRPVDSDGDMMPITSENQMATDSEAVYYATDARLALIYGEWWEDPTLGFKLVDFLISTARSGNADFLRNYITDYIKATEGCTGVTNDTVTYRNRQLTYNCVVLTQQGGIGLEVGEDELLGSVY